MDVVLHGVLVDERVDLLRIREGVVDLDEGVPLVRERVLGKDRLDRALRLAGPAVDALLRVDDEDPPELVDAVDRADIDARAVFDVDAGLGDDVRHARESSRGVGVAYAVSVGAGIRELGDHIGGPFDERRLDDHLVEARRVRALQAGLVGVVRVAEDRDVGPGVDDLLRLDAGDVGDHEVGRSDAVARHEPVPGKETLQLPAEEEVDPDQQDRRHAPTLAPPTDADNRRSWDSSADWSSFATAPTSRRTRSSRTSGASRRTAERDFLQGLVHVSVAWLHAERGNRNGCERQLAKAERRLAGYRPSHRGCRRRTRARRRRAARATSSAQARWSCLRHACDQNAGSRPSHSRKRFR